jgi:dCMP deaminase
MTRWDKYFLGMCESAAANTQCFSRKVGAIIVKDKSIISTGYNGPPRGVPPCDQRWDCDISLMTIKLHPDEDVKGRCPRHVMGYKSGEGLEYCVAGHAERNSIVNAAREGVGSVKGCIMYMNCAMPCSPCLVEIINAGISEIVITKGPIYDRTSQYLVKQSGLKVREYDQT